MTGPEHQGEAERLLLSCQLEPATEYDAATYPANEDGANTICNALVAALVHATLALADTLRSQPGPGTYPGPCPSRYVFDTKLLAPANCLGLGGHAGLHWRGELVWDDEGKLR